MFSASARSSPSQSSVSRDDRRDQLEAGDARGAQPALARDQLVAAARQRPDHDRLEHAARADGLGQLLESDLVEVCRGW